MEKISLLKKEKGCALYSVDGDSSLKRYIASTTETRAVLNKPEIVGYEFRHKMANGTAKVLKALELDVDGQHSNVIHFLRGGLNFGLMEALHKAYGLNNHSASFMSSERRKQDGKWRIKDDQYSKLTINAGSTVFIGDIVATGVTLEAGLAKIYEQVTANELPDAVKEHVFHGIEDSQKRQHIPLKGIAFFTIGCENIEKILGKYDKLFKDAFPEYSGTHVVYLEGKFKLASSSDNLRIKIDDTDLLRHPAVLAPEFELSQYESVAYPLERCVVYDGGSRSFNAAKHLAEVKEYWEKLGDSGMTLEEALKERWPEKGYESIDNLAAEKKDVWAGVNEGALGALCNAYSRRWNDSFRKKASGKDSLRTFCGKRMERL